MSSSELVLSNDIRFVPSAIQLHDKVFNDTAPSLYNNKEEWLRRITQGGYFVVVLEGGSVIGFTVCDVTSDKELKVWLVGVDPESRGKGVWSRMYERVVLYAVEQGYSSLLLNTYPQKFPAMFAFLQKMRADIYKEETIEGFTKVYAKINL